MPTDSRRPGPGQASPGPPPQRNQTAQCTASTIFGSSMGEIVVRPRSAAKIKLLRSARVLAHIREMPL